MKLSRKWLLVIALVLSMTMAISGTMAYLQDTATDVNTMTLGSVHIEQHEYERVVENGSYITETIDDVESYVLRDFNQPKPLLPIVGSPASEEGYSSAGWDDTVVRMTQAGSYGSMQVFAGKNAVDKFVTVENTGKSDAYIRTIVAIEIGSAEADLIGTSHHSTWTSTTLENKVQINGNNYSVIAYSYNGGELENGIWRHKDGILPAGDTSYPNLSQVYLKSRATNEDMVKIDGNANGTLDILVLSQAIQADGFANAEAALNAGFGKVDEENVKAWFEADDSVSKLPVIQTVTNADELDKALEDVASGTTIVLANDITGTVDAVQSAEHDVIIDGNGHTITGSIRVNGQSSAYPSAGLTIKDVNFKTDSTDDFVFIELGQSGDTSTRYTNNVTISNCTFTAAGDTAVAVKSYTGGDKNLTIENCTVKPGMHSLVQVANVDNLVIKDCRIYSKNGINVNQSPNVTIENCTANVKGYAVRFGASSGSNGVNETYVIKDSNLTSTLDESGDAVIMLRGTAEGSTLTLENTTLNGTPEIINSTNANVVGWNSN